MKIFGLVLAAALVATTVGTGVRAATLYDNGPVDGNRVGWYIGGGGYVADSFNAASGSVVTGASFAMWLNPGDKLNTVVWTISSGNPFSGGRTIASGTASPSGTILIPHNGEQEQVVDESFSINPATLSGGGYFFELSDARTMEGITPFWDDNNGPSQAFLDGPSLAGYDYPGSTGSETFQIIGTGPISAAPEPSTWGLMLAGVAMIGATLRFGRRQRLLTV